MSGRWRVTYQRGSTRLLVRSFPLDKRTRLIWRSQAADFHGQIVRSESQCRPILLTRHSLLGRDENLVERTA